MVQFENLRAFIPAKLAFVDICFKSQGSWKSTLVTSKACLAPLNAEFSIPRLELLAALISACLASSVQEALLPVLRIDGIFCWTDSKVVWYWIQSDRDYKQFVYNRRSEIVKLTDINAWRHCPARENPADLGSRGCFTSGIASNRLWWEGPSWIRGPPSFCRGL